MKDKPSGYVNRSTFIVAGISTLLALLLTQFQNCAQEGADSLAESESDTVRIVDDYSSLKVAFIENRIETHDEAESLTIDGLCARKGTGQAIHWELVDMGENVIAAGESYCERGGFRVELNGLASANCGQDLRVHAENDLGDFDAVLVNRRCAPLERLIVDQQDPRVCYLELEAAEDLASSERCYYSCYRNSRLVNREQAALNECKDLQAHNTSALSN